jgi:hypothetical protein
MITISMNYKSAAFEVPGTTKAPRMAPVGMSIRAVFGDCTADESRILVHGILDLPSNGSFADGRPGKTVWPVTKRHSIQVQRHLFQHAYRWAHVPLDGQARS